MMPIILGAVRRAVWTWERHPGWTLPTVAVRGPGVRLRGPLPDQERGGEFVHAKAFVYCQARTPSLPQHRPPAKPSDRRSVRRVADRA